MPVDTMTLPGQPLRVRFWVLSDGKGLWPSVTVVDSANKTTNLYGQYLTEPGWQKVELSLPTSGVQYPVRTTGLRIIETKAAASYSGSVVFDDFEVDVPAEVESPEEPAAQRDRLIDADGVLPAGGDRWTFAALSDVQFTAANQELVPVAVQALRRIRATSPDLVVLNGDIIDEGNTADVSLARQTLEAGGCDLVAAGEALPAPTASTVPCLYVPGNHEYYGTTDLGPWRTEFGEPYRTLDHKGTLLLAGASSAPAAPRDCGAIRFSGTTTHVVVLRGVSCQAAKRVARRYDKGRPSGRWACALAHAPFRQVLGHDVGFSCGNGGSSGDISKWPRAFVGTLH